MRYLRIFITVTILAIIAAGCSSGKKEMTIETLSPEEIIQMGDSQFTLGDYKKAIETYKLVFVYHPTSDMHIDARLRIAECFGEMEEFEDQMEELLILIRENTVPERVPEVYVQLGKFYERAARFNPGMVSSDTTDYKQAMDYYNKAASYTDSNIPLAKANAHYRIALVLAKMNKTDRASEQYQYVSNRYPDTVYALLAQLKLKDPGNTAELPADELSLQKYRQELGMGGEESEPAEAESEADVEGDNPETVVNQDGDKQ